MRAVDVVVIGAGQAGLAASACLGARGIGHVVLDRGRIGERWRSERWDGLRLLTPRWQSRLPGWSYTGPDRHGYMGKDELVAYLEAYAQASAAPVREGVAVLDVRPCDGGFLVATDDGTWRARAVVVATGACDRPHVPAFASRLDPRLDQLTPDRFRDAASVAPGGVLVVGASATGVQLADALRADGREVVLAVGNHARLPRRWRGRDIQYWLDRSGILREAVPARARPAPSLQLVGRQPTRAVDLEALQHRGVRLVGRLHDLDGRRAGFVDDLAESTARAHRRMHRTLDRIDRWADVVGGADTREERPAAVVPGVVPTHLDLAAEGIRTVLWATGHRRSHPWLRVPVIEGGDIRHVGGVTPWPGLYVLGMPGLRTRRSTFLDGVGDDARHVVAHAALHLDLAARRAA